MPTPKYHIYIGHHFYGAGNFGDDLMMAGFLEVVKPHLSQLRLTCSIPFDPTSQKRRFPEIEWLPYDLQIRERLIQECDVWLGLGDSPFQTDVGMWILHHLENELEMCKRFRKPMFFLGVGMNNIEAIRQSQTGALVEYATHIWTRDSQTADALEHHYGRDNVTEGSDLAHIYLQQCNFSTQEHDTIAYLLNFERRDLFDPQVFQHWIVSRNNMRHRWLIQEVRSLPGSEYDLLNGINPIYQEKLDIRKPDYRGDSLQQYLQRWGNPSIVITSRYHGVLVAAWMGCRVLPIERNDKLRWMVSQLKLPSLMSFTSVSEVQKVLEKCYTVSYTTLMSLAKLAISCCEDFLSRINRL